MGPKEIMDSLPALVNDLLPRVFSCLCAEQDLGYIGMCDPKQSVGVLAVLVMR